MFMGVGMFCYLAVCSGAEDILPARVNCYWLELFRFLCRLSISYHVMFFRKLFFILAKFIHSYTPGTTGIITFEINNSSEMEQ